MEKKLSAGIFIFFLFMFIGNVQAQDEQTQGHTVTINIPEVVLLDLEAAGSGSIILTPESPNTAGLQLDFTNVINNELWINYSSIVGGNTEPKRTVNVAVTGTIPDGVNIKVSASNDVGKGSGAVGIPLGEITLSNEAQAIITGIGSCFTGDGINKGHRLTYSLELKSPDSYAALDYEQSRELTVTYTLSDK